MRRRTEATKTTPEAATPTAPAEAERDDAAADFAKVHTVTTEHASRTRERAPLEVIDRALDEGDALALTLGSETFTPIRFHPFVVGPISATVRVRAGESATDAYVRARALLSHLFEVEFEQRYVEAFRRMKVAAAESVKAKVPVS